MKKLRKKLKKLNNHGSSLVMVVAALAFIGIIVGALLTAAGYAYKMKMQDLNAKDNFYYVEQAMDEIYAGVGSVTVDNLKEAYLYTVENMVYYDADANTPETGYTAWSQDDAQKFFKFRFMQNLSTNAFFNPDAIADRLEEFISNDTVVLDKSKVSIVKEYDNGILNKITIKNITLSRKQEYKNNAKGNYLQTISTDIVISEPDFDVNLSPISTDYDNIFDFAMVADMGVEIKNSPSVSIVGNVYAASDYYNKNYNLPAGGFTSSVTKKYSTREYGASEVNNDYEVTYDHVPISNRKYSIKDDENTYKFYDAVGKKYEGKFDGINERSRYSGLYIDNSKVSVLADTVIIPGCLSVFNTSSLSVFGKTGLGVSPAEVWADDIILGGYSVKNTTGSVTKDVGSSAIFNANIYVKDDTELNAAGSQLEIIGSYYGYGDSTEKDTRTFIAGVDLKKFKNDSNGDGKVTTSDDNKGHFNSSAIVINGENSTLALNRANKLYIAGRAYIELTKHKDLENSGAQKVDGETREVTSYIYEPESNKIAPDKENGTIQAGETSYIRDYKTGESISVKSNQVAYIPAQAGEAEPIYSTDGTYAGYWMSTLSDSVSGRDFFNIYFPTEIFGGKCPTIVQMANDKRTCYYDFDTAYKLISKEYDDNASFKATLDARIKLYYDDTEATFDSKFPSAYYFESEFFDDYVANLNLENGKAYKNRTKLPLTDIRNTESFNTGNISVSTDANSSVPNAPVIYSSGAITTKSGVKFNISSFDDPDLLDKLFSSNDYTGNTESYNNIDGILSKAFNYSSSLSREYEYIKWNLGHFDKSYDLKIYNGANATTNLVEEDYVDKFIEENGSGYLTPINKYLNFKDIKSGSKTIKLDSGYYAIASSDNVTITKDMADSAGVFKGIIITKGDVSFENTVRTFEGLIVSAGKIYIDGNVTSLTANAEICRAVLKSLQLNGGEDEEYILKLFKSYVKIMDESGSSDSDSDSVTIDTIDYTDVVQYANWMKNVD